MTKVKVPADKSVRTLKGVACVNEVRFARKLANCNKTKFASTYARQHDSVGNPALFADSYTEADDFRHDYLLYNVLRKFNAENKDGASERARCAFEKFLSVDESLADINRNLNWSFLALNEPVVHHILWRASRKMERLLGPLNIGNVLELSAFSHGATSLHKRIEGRAPFKFSFENPEVTPACAKLAWACIQQVPSWADSVKSLTLVEGNRLTTVPKDSSIDRVIACEPTMNMFIQKGIGSFIRKMLKSVNIDLDDQSNNQALARSGSIDESLATVDLSAASDSISLAICKLLLPEQWYDFMLTTRSDIGFLPDGQRIVYNKISSMGNGFTFELESALFWAITQSCEDVVSESRGVPNHRCSVYGDDIICRTETVCILRTVLELCGFSLNMEKSFSIGPFRESCGKHYFNGIDVSPFFIRGPVNSPLELIGLCNRLRRWNRSVLGTDDPRYVDLYNWACRYLPDFWQVPRIPDGYGDGALYGSLDEVKPTFIKGIYKAPTISINEAVITEHDERYANLDLVFNGRGGLLATLCSYHEVHDRMRFATQLEYIQYFVRKSSSVATSVLPTGQIRREVLTIPGVMKVARKRVSLYEWLDSV